MYGEFSNHQESGPRPNEMRSNSSYRGVSPYNLSSDYRKQQSMAPAQAIDRQRLNSGAWQAGASYVHSLFFYMAFYFNFGDKL